MSVDMCKQIRNEKPELVVLLRPAFDGALHLLRVFVSHALLWRLSCIARSEGRSARFALKTTCCAFSLLSQCVLKWSLAEDNLTYSGHI